MYVKNSNPKNIGYSHIHTLDLSVLEDCIYAANEYFVESYRIRHRFDPANFIPLRNLSGGVGESFASVLIEKQQSDMILNPHPDGYPDILPLTEEAQPWIQNPRLEDFRNGGFDVKSKYISDNYTRIDIGASAHHKKTTSVLNVMWKWKSDVPFIVGLAYTNDLTPNDWQTPTMGRTTSKTTPSCNLNINGKMKLRSGWLILHENIMNVLSSRKDWIGLPDRIL